MSALYLTYYYFNISIRCYLIEVNGGFKKVRLVYIQSKKKSGKM